MAAEGAKRWPRNGVWLRIGVGERAACGNLPPPAALGLLNIMRRSGLRGGGRDVMANRKHRLGVIGCGAFAHFTTRAFQSMENVEVVAAADNFAAAAEAFGREFPALTIYPDAMALIGAGDVEIVHIVTPPSSHHALAMAALNAGKHVLCEKPLATTAEHADEMMQAAKRAGKIMPVNFVMRYNAVVEAVRAIIESEVLGQPLHAMLDNFAGDDRLDAGHWFWDKNLSGGIFVEHGVHFFDLYARWFGDGEVVAAHTEVRPGTSQEDRVTCTVRHAGAGGTGGAAGGGPLAQHYHGFDQPALLDRARHRLLFETGDIIVEGWIPLQLELNGLVDERGHERLKGMEHGRLETLESFGAQGLLIRGRGKLRRVHRRVRMQLASPVDKQRQYAQSVIDLLADQLQAIDDASHIRRVTEQNGRAALALALAAKDMAARSGGGG